MIQGDLLYDPVKDIAPVDQNGYIDLVQAFEDRVIPSDISGGELEFTDCEDTDSLLPRAEDVFDQIQQAHTLRSLKDVKESEASNPSDQ